AAPAESTASETALPPGLRFLLIFCPPVRPGRRDHGGRDQGPRAAADSVPRPKETAGRARNPSSINVVFQEDSRMSRTIRTSLLTIAAVALTAAFAAAQGHTSSKFSGPKVNAGTVTHSV